MNPIDLRNETWETLQTRITGLRLMILDAWRCHGRCTTRELADRAGLDILTVRPRTTELVEMGMVRCVDRVEHEGIYEARTEAEARENFLQIKGGAAVQTELKL